MVQSQLRAVVPLLREARHIEPDVLRSLPTWWTNSSG